MSPHGWRFSSIAAMFEEQQPRDGGKAGPMRILLALLVIASGVFFAAALSASQPVRVTITGCVKGGELWSEKTDFGTHASEGKYRIKALARGGAPIELTRYEGNRISAAGHLLPGDRFYADESSLRVLGACVPPPGAASAGADPRGPEGQGAATRLTPEKQEALARELYGTMAKTDTWDTDVFIRLHRRVIEECPDTKRAQESLWRLSNLYLTGTGSDPDYPEIVRLLERLVERYPDSPLVWDAKQRLLVAYENTGEMKKARALYEEQLASDKDLPKSGDYAAVLLGYAQSLAATGEPGRARDIYRKILALDPPAESWLMDIVKDDLSALDKPEKNKR
jgi:tetratricopeptide (TPR) repeat protein